MTLRSFCNAIHHSFYVFSAIIVITLIHIAWTYEEYESILGWIGGVGFYGSLFSLGLPIEVLLPSGLCIGVLVKAFAVGIRMWYDIGPSFIPLALVTASSILLTLSIALTVYLLPPISGQGPSTHHASFPIFVAIIAIIGLALTRIRSNPGEYDTVFGWVPIIGCYGIFVSIGMRITIFNITFILAVALFLAEGIRASIDKETFLMGVLVVISSLIILTLVFWFQCLSTMG